MLLLWCSADCSVVLYLTCFADASTYTQVPSYIFHMDTCGVNYNTGKIQVLTLAQFRWAFIVITFIAIIGK